MGLVPRQEKMSRPPRTLNCPSHPPAHQTFTYLSFQ